jgi:hypothetical protein
MQTVRTADIVRLLPKSLQARFTSLGGYVTAILSEVGPIDPPLPDEQVQFIQLAALVYALDEFLRAGTRAAKSACSNFEALGAEGFAVGGTIFTKDGAATLRGERLATALRASIAEGRIKDAISSASSIRGLVKDLAWTLPRGRRPLG